MLAATNETLILAAKATNDFTDLSMPHKLKPSINPEIRAAQKVSLDCAKTLRALSSAPLPEPARVIEAQLKCTEARASLQRLIRSHHQLESNKRDQHLHSVLEKRPAALFKSIRSLKGSSSGEIKKLTVR